MGCRYSIASLRMLHPNLFPSELILSAHDKFLGINSEVPAAWKEARGDSRAAKAIGKVPEKVFTVVRGKIATFPWSGTLRTINGLLQEGQGELQEAMAEYVTRSSVPSPLLFPSSLKADSRSQRQRIVEQEGPSTDSSSL